MADAGMAGEAAAAPGPAQSGQEAAPYGRKQAAKAAGQVAHPSLEERRAKGREARDRVPPSGHSRWRPAAARPDPVALLEEQDTTRKRTWCRSGTAGCVSPFTFYRGAATIMAADLKDTPVAGLGVQLCGTRTCPTSARSPPPNGGCCST